MLDCPSGCESKVDTTRLLVAQAQKRVEMYQSKHWEYPDSLQDVYGDGSIPTDSWGNPIRLADSPHGKFVVSFGADGVAGGEGEAADLFHGAAL